MSIKLKKYSILIIAAVLVVAMAFAGAASADNWIQHYNKTWYDAEGGDSVDTYHIYDAASLAALSEKVSINSTTKNFSGKTIAIMNDIDLSGHDWVPIGTQTDQFSGNFTGDGYGKTISNYNISAGSVDCIGLIGYYTGSKISNLTLRDFNVSVGSDCSDVGSLVGYAASTSGETLIENVCAKFGTVTGNNSVGGLVGNSHSAKTNFVKCTAENCMISSSGKYGLGGLIGHGYSANCFDNSAVKSCSVSSSGPVGGLIGVAFATGTPAFMHACTVTNCIISSSNFIVGGLVGYAESAGAGGFAQCVVEDCMIVSTCNNLVGGLVGVANSAGCVFNAGNWVNDSAVHGNLTGSDEYPLGDYIGEVVGADSGSLSKRNIADYSSTGNVSSDGSIWLNNNSNANYPKIYIAKDPVKQGLENSTNFNEGLTASSVPEGAKLVTQLTGYGPNGKYAALGYVYESLTLYGINITNATGTYQLTSAMTKVYGDYGMDNGTAVLTNESGNLVLTLTGFKASNMTGNVPIINASVADLTIKLVGESNLTGGYEDSTDVKGLVYCSGNLTITTSSPGSKLLVNNTKEPEDEHVISSIVAGENLTIENNVIVIATATSIESGIDGAQALSSENADIKISGENTIVNATAISDNGRVYAIFALQNILIENGAKVNATATGNESAFAIKAGYNVSISGEDTIVKAHSTTNSTVEDAYSILTSQGGINITDANVVEANATNNGGNAYSLCSSYGYIKIDSAKLVTATADGYNYAYALGSGGDVTITGADAVYANAHGSTGQVYAICTWYQEDILIDSVGELNATACGNYYTSAIYSGGNLTVKGTDTRITAKAASGENEADAIRASDSIQIDSAKLVNATADGYTDAYGIVAIYDVNITDADTIRANANSSTGEAYAISNGYASILIDSADVVTATACGDQYASAIYSHGGNITINGTDTKITTKAESSNDDANAIFAKANISIESAKKVTATAETRGSGNKFAYGLNAEGAITITDSLDVTATATAPYANSIATTYAPKYNMVNTQGNAAVMHDVVITNSKVTAKAEGDREACALMSQSGNITITGDKTVIDANATCIEQALLNADATCTDQAVIEAIAIWAKENITITSAEKIKAIGTGSSFIYNKSGLGSLNIDELADYKFSNASVNGAEPKSYATFVNSSNWYDFEGYTLSNFTAVLIEKKATTPSYTGSSSKQTGYTVILQDTVVPADAADTAATMYTVNFSMNGHGIQVMNQSVSFGNTAEEPSPVPTADGYTFTGWYADKGLVSKYAFSTPVTDDIELYAGWAAKDAKTPTSKSPAPFLGILAGLGAVAVLLRLRK